MRTVPIDYKAAAREFRAQKAALTRAKNSKDPAKIIAACRKAVAQWDQPDRAWPDDWARWQVALNDALPWNQWTDLRDLDRAHGVGE